jgi:three-Cys-motif partner protein
VARKQKQSDPRQRYFFEEPPQYLPADPTFKPLEYPVWTRNKALLVQRYLRYFVFITKHGTYIDGFAGPQEPKKLETWAAKRVLENDPRWLRNFFFCELNKNKIPLLTALERGPAGTNANIKRRVRVYQGDFNERVDDILASGVITPKEATFCLLDQRTFECDWSTVVKLAQHKKENKIELFYFLGTGWLHRAFSGLKKQPAKRMTRWWGRDDWHRLEPSKARSITDAFVQRFKEELGYRYANAFPIYEKDREGSRAMYQMIHASDHPESLTLMVRAYRRAVDPEEPPDQIKMELGNS